MTPVEVVHYHDRRGSEPVVAYLDDLVRHGEPSVIATIARMVDLLGEKGAGLGMPLDRLIDRRSRIYELRPGDHRIAYAEVGAGIILLHAWRKRTQQLDRRHAATALARLSDWLEREGVRD